MKFVPKEIEEYCTNISTTPSSLCSELADYTRQNVDLSVMLIGPMEASVLTMLIHQIRPKTIIEFGTFTGYSALAMAEQVESDGKIFTLDVNADTQNLAQSFWDKSPHGHKIVPICGQALETMGQITAPLDLVFIDADKTNYRSYFQYALENLSPKGVIVLDNMLWSGRVLEEGQLDDSTLALKKLAREIQTADRLIKTLLPIRDGMLVVQLKVK